MKLFYIGINLAYKLIIQTNELNTHKVKLIQYCNNLISNIIEKKYIIDTIKKLELEKCKNTKETEYEITIFNLPQHSKLKFNQCHLFKNKLQDFLFPLNYGLYQFGPIRCLFSLNTVSCYQGDGKFIKHVLIRGKYKSEKNYKLAILVQCQNGYSYYINKRFSPYKRKALSNNKEIDYEIDFQCYSGIKKIDFDYNTDFKDTEIIYNSDKKATGINFNLNHLLRFHISCYIIPLGLLECQNRLNDS